MKNIFFKEVVKYGRDMWGNSTQTTYTVREPRKIAWAGAIIAAFLIVFCPLTCIVTVPTGHTGVVATFGQVQDYTYDSGIHFKAPWQRVVKMDNRIQKQTVELACFSSDIQEVSMTYTINYQINKANAQNIYKGIGIHYYDTVIIPCVAENAKIVVAQFTAEELVGKRDSLAIAIEEALATKLEQYNIELVSTSVENIDFTDAFTNAVERKQVAQQEKLRAQTEAERMKIEAEAAAEVKRIEAEAEAAANRAITASLSQEILLNKYLERWDGVMPKVMGSEGTLIEIPLGE